VCIDTYSGKTTTSILVVGTLFSLSYFTITRQWPPYICFFHPFPHDGAMERASYYLVSSEIYKSYVVSFVSVQSALLKEYPNKMLVTVTQCVFSTVQSFVVAVVAERDFSKWKLRFDISLLAIIYTVIHIINLVFLCSLILFLTTI